MNRSLWRARGLAALPALILAVVVTGVATTAHATPDDDWEAPVRAFWSEYGVEGSVQDELIAGIYDGELPDALDSGVPISNHQFVAGGELVSIDTFADGSILVTTLEQPADPDPGDAQTFGIENCSPDHYTGVTYYVGCKITGQSGLIGISFWASYTIQHTTYDIIPNSGWSPQCSVFPGTCSVPNITYYKANETAGSRAALQYSTAWTLSAGGVSGSGVLNLSLRVQNNSATSYLFE